MEYSKDLQSKQVVDFKHNEIRLSLINAEADQVRTQLSQLQQQASINTATVDQHPVTTVTIKLPENSLSKLAFAFINSLTPQHVHAKLRYSLPYRETRNYLKKCSADNPFTYPVRLMLSTLQAYSKRIHCSDTCIILQLD